MAYSGKGGGHSFERADAGVLVFPGAAASMHALLNDGIEHFDDELLLGAG